MKTRTLETALLVSMPSIALAAPSGVTVESGTLVEGDTVVLSGSAFGVHEDHYTTNADQLAWKWQNFETALEHDGLSLSGDYEGTYWQRLTDGGRSGWWAKRFSMGAPSNVQGLQSGSDVNSTGVLFVSYWSFVPEGASNGKAMRFVSKPWNTDGFVNWYFNLANGLITQ